jgi:hypothetical protein
MVYRSTGEHYAYLTLLQDGNRFSGKFHLIRINCDFPLSGNLIDRELRIEVMPLVDMEVAKRLNYKTSAGKDVPAEVLQLLQKAGAIELFVFRDVDPKADTLALGNVFNFWYEYGTKATGLFSQEYYLKQFYNGGDPRAVEKGMKARGPYTLRRHGLPKSEPERAPEAKLVQSMREVERSNSARVREILESMKEKGELEGAEYFEIMNICSSSRNVDSCTSLDLGDILTNKLPYQMKFEHAVRTGNFHEADKVRQEWLKVVDAVLSIPVFTSEWQRMAWRQDTVLAGQSVAGAIRSDISSPVKLISAKVTQRTCLTTSDLKTLYEGKAQQTVNILLEVVMADLLPFRPMFYLAIEKDDFDEAELIRRLWFFYLQQMHQILKGSSKEATTKLEIQMKKLQVVGLTDPLLIKLRKELIQAIDTKNWDAAQKIQVIIASRTEEIRPREPLVIEKPVEKVAGRSSGAPPGSALYEGIPEGKTTNIIIQQSPPPESQVKVEGIPDYSPRYGATDVARAISLLQGRGGRLTDKEAGALKLFDMLMKR